MVPYKHNPEEPDMALLSYKLDQLTNTVNAGFQRIDNHLEKQDVRVNDLYIWRAGIETKTAAGGATLSGKDLGKIILGIIAALTLALTIIAQAR